MLFFHNASTPRMWNLALERAERGPQSSSLVGAAQAACSHTSAACRQDRGLSQPLLSGALPEGSQPAGSGAVMFAFEGVCYAVLLAAERRVKRVLSDVSGVNAPVSGLLTPEAARGAFAAAPALMCILGPSGAGVRCVACRGRHGTAGVHLLYGRACVGTSGARAGRLPPQTPAPSCIHDLAVHACIACGAHVATAQHVCSLSHSASWIAGKSSLLDIVSGRRSGPTVQGQLSINGRPVTASQVRAASGYVHQVCLNTCADTTSCVF